MQVYEKEMGTLLEAALRYLERPWENSDSHSPIKANLFNPSLRVWQFSVITDVSWTIFVPKLSNVQVVDANHWLARRVTWQKSHDMLRFTDPMEGLKQGINSPPTIHIEDRLIEKSACLLEIGKFSFAIPVIRIQEFPGFDRDESGVETFNFLSRVRLSWRNVGPQEWKEFTNRVDYFRDFLDSFFKNDE